MGADGGIRIYDWEKFESNFGKEKAQSFILITNDSTTYLHLLPIPGREDLRVLTIYNGDNIWCKTVIDSVAENDIDDFLAKEINSCSIPLEELKKMVEYLFNECYMTEWEVWT